MHPNGRYLADVRGNKEYTHFELTQGNEVVLRAVRLGSPLSLTVAWPRDPDKTELFLADKLVQLCNALGETVYERGVFVNDDGNCCVA